MRFTQFFSIVVGLFIFGQTAQIVAQISQESVRELDKNFAEWKGNTSPGIAAGIIKDGEIIYLKGFGSANLENGMPITPQTKFQLGELSKQFTTLAILLLENQEKIKMTDDIRKYIPELPEYLHKVSISHLVNHSSGFYDIRRINAMINGSEVISTQEEALNLIAAQKTLAFKPGTDFSYHEAITESILMAVIVARVTSQSFAEFVKINIFQPLEMSNSFIRDDYNLIIPNVAESYQKIQDGEGFKKHHVQSSVVGAINAYSSAEDLAKWYLNFTSPKGVVGNMIQKLDTPVKLSNGTKFVYYWGEMAIGREFRHPERGLSIVWNYGLHGGYGSNIFRFSEPDVTSFVLGNNGQYNGSLAKDALDPFLKNLYLEPATIDFNALKIKKMSAKKLKDFEGYYWFKKAGYASEIFVENDTLRSKWTFSKGSIKLVPISNNTFQQYGTEDEVRLFNFKKEGPKTTLFFTYNWSQPDVMERYEPIIHTEQSLQSYVGTYYSASYDSLFSFQIVGGKLAGTNFNHPEIIFKSIKNDEFTSTSTFFNAIEFLRDKSGEIRGFKMDTDGIHNFVLKKIR